MTSVVPDCCALKVPQQELIKGLISKHKTKSNMNILFIGPIFNGYEETIKSTIEKSRKYERIGFIQECPFKSLGLFAFTTNIIPSIKSRLIKLHNDRILNAIRRNKYDLVFIIRGEYILSQTIETIHSQYPSVAVVVYQWDSITNNQNALSLVKIADKAFTFDMFDAQKLGISYLPLFSSWAEAGCPMSNNAIIKYDVLSIGGYRPHRIPYINAIKKYCDNKGLSYKFHNFIRFGAYIKNRKKLHTIYKDVSFRKISYNKYYKLMCESRVILDVQSPSQNGLTMRTMESLSLGKKLITTNLNIKNEAVNNSNVFVISAPSDIYTPEFDSFMKAPSVTCSKVLSLTEWLKYMQIL